MGVRFEEVKLRERVSTLPRRSRIAFAAACAARLENTARGLRVDDDLKALLSRVIDSVVADLGRGLFLDTGAMEETLLHAMPDEDACPDFASAIAEDATAALVYTLRATRSDDPQDVVWAARRAYETSDREVLRSLNVNAVTDGEEAYVLQHPIVQTELQRQSRDLVAVSRIDGDAPTALTAVVARARSENILKYDP